MVGAGATSEFTILWDDRAGASEHKLSKFSCHVVGRGTIVGLMAGAIALVSAMCVRGKGWVCLWWRREDSQSVIVHGVK